MPQVKHEKKKETNAGQSQTSPLIDEKSPKLLFVDSLLPIELIVSFSSMSRWYEQKMEIPEKVIGKTKKAESIVPDHETMSVAES